MGGITLYINHIPLSQFGGKLRANYTVSGSAVTADYYKPRDGNAFISLGSRIGLKIITLPFDLYGSSPRETKRNLSALDALCLSGKVELYLPDGFYYTSILQSIGVPQQITPSILSCSYVFLGIQHDKMVKAVSNGSFQAQGTLPKMDCILSASPSADVEKYVVAGITFTNVHQGDQIVIDGITKRILITGGPAAQRCDIIDFLYLVPGDNTISCIDPVTVQYYPSYV